MAKLSVEQRGQIRGWLREQLATNPERRQDGGSLTRALGFEVTNGQVDAAYRDILALSPANKERLNDWIARNYGKARIEGYEWEVRWRKWDDHKISRAASGFLGATITTDHLTAALAATGKKWGTQKHLNIALHWANEQNENDYCVVSAHELSTWTDSPHPVAGLIVAEGADPNAIHAFLRSSLERVDEMIAGVYSDEQELVDRSRTPFPVAA